VRSDVFCSQLQGDWIKTDDALPHFGLWFGHGAHRRSTRNTTEGCRNAGRLRFGPVDKHEDAVRFPFERASSGKHRQSYGRLSRFRARPLEISIIGKGFGENQLSFLTWSESFRMQCSTERRVRWRWHVSLPFARTSSACGSGFCHEFPDPGDCPLKRCFHFGFLICSHERPVLLQGLAVPRATF
jgi:hypothetical protein